MMRSSRTTPRLGAALLLAAAACSASSTAAPGPAPGGTVTVRVEPAAVTLQPGARQAFSAVQTGTAAGVSWTVLEGAAGGAVSTGGLYTAPGGTGTFHVVATSLADTSRSGSAAVTVVAAPPPPPGVVVTVSPASATVQAGGTFGFTASVANATNTAVTWAVQEAAGGTVSAAGLYTAPATPGTYHVVATSVQDGTKTGQATVTVTAPVTVTISPRTASILVGGAQQFSAAVANTANTAVSWTVQEGAAGGSVGSTGLYTAPSTPGTYHVVATSLFDGSRSDTATVTVSAAPALAVSPASASVRAGATQQFTVTPAVAVTWSLDEGGGGSPPPLDASTYAYPLKVAAGGRSLVDQNGKPFRVHGDTAWSLIANVSAADTDVYLADRQARGFNTIIVNLIEHQFARNAPNLLDGTRPFTTAGDLSTHNDAYFNFAVSSVQKAASRGIHVLLTPAYMGYLGGSEGWFQEMSGNSAAKCLDYGTYVGNKFKALPNITWVHGGDYTPPSGSAGETCALQIMAGIKSVAAAGGPAWLHTGHWGDPVYSTQEANFASSMNVNAVYRYDIPADMCRAAFRRTPVLPAFLFETGYENEQHGGPIRKFMWWGSLACGGGAVFGNNPIWLMGFTSPGNNGGNWKAALGSPGAVEMGHLRNLLEPIPWNELVPEGIAGMKTLITAGGGADSTQGDYVTAAATPSGKWLLAYVPPTGTGTRSITVDLTALSGPGTASWYNPTTGSSVAIGAFANAGTRAFTTPGNNGSGQNDWVLVLDASGGAGRCGTVSAGGLYTAPAAVPSPATCHVRATDGGGASAAATVTVTP